MSLLRIEGEVEIPLELGYEELAALPDQVPDCSRVVPGRAGHGVRLMAVLERARPHPEATHLELESGDGSFTATLPLAAVTGAVLAYRLGGGPLPPAKGGPIRFLTPHDGDCDKADGHACANVKGLALLRLVRM
jgi:DMSO/TMAO reductase YedYZ molybdopterin-dependent catalytic subunit